MSELPPTMSALKLKGDVEPLRENVIADVRPILRTLFMAAVIALLVACVNVSGLLLVRAIRERREFAVRVAIGASSNRIIRESAVEGMLLSVLAGMLGLAFAAIAIRAALHYLPASLPRISSVSIDPLGRRFCASRRRRHRRSLQPRARVRCFAHQSDRHPERRRASRQYEPHVAPFRLGRCGSRHRACSSHRVWNVSAQPAKDARRESWFPLRSRSRRGIPAPASAISNQRFRLHFQSRRGRPAFQQAWSERRRDQQRRCRLPRFPARRLHRRRRVRRAVETEIRRVHQRLWKLLRRDGHSPDRWPNLRRARRCQRPACRGRESVHGSRLLARAKPARQAHARRQSAQGISLGQPSSVLSPTPRSRATQPGNDQWYTPMEQPATLYGSATPGNLSGPSKWLHHHALAARSGSHDPDSALHHR